MLDVGFISSPTIIDIDNDNDLEIIIGTNQNLSVYDIKDSPATNSYYWTTYRGDYHNTGTFTSNTSVNIGDLNSDGANNILDIVQLATIIIGNISNINSNLLTK